MNNIANDDLNNKCLLASRKQICTQTRLVICKQLAFCEAGWRTYFIDTVFEFKVEKIKNRQSNSGELTLLPARRKNRCDSSFKGIQA